ncbi:MAG: glycosyltransferase [Candidatus Brocadiae bacterium]|nr:glycosyltransferase [Candidatus Brocadiia bacterium]
MSFMDFIFYLPFLSLILWLGAFLFARNSYLYRHVFSNSSSSEISDPPFLSIIIPARNEEEVLKDTLPSILQQEYKAKEVILVDDHSTDKTYAVARSIQEQYKNNTLEIIQGKPLQEGWAGKLWALNQGLAKAKGEWILLTDADLYYAPNLLPSLMAFATEKKASMVSLMAKLRTNIFWEKLLIPSFLYFFKLMYPFGSVSNPDSKVAAAAGGCILIRKEALEEIGGIASIKNALIDDISLAKKIKEKGHSLFLMDGPDLESKRGYDTLSGIWNMVARSAFTELKYSYIRLSGCTLIMLIAFAMPILGSFFPLFAPVSPLLFLPGFIAWLLMSITYLPTIQYFKVFPAFALTLPLSGLLYLAMTLSSAKRYFLGTKSHWKGRDYKK